MDASVRGCDAPDLRVRRSLLALLAICFGLATACSSRVKAIENTSDAASSIDRGDIVDASMLDVAKISLVIDSGGSCPPEMVLVEGDYCPKVIQTCKKWLDEGRFHDYRCAEYMQPARCVSERVKERFCVDREEYVAAGDALPLAHQSWTTAGDVCKSDGKRLCLESEWQFACEGPEMHPYPYGDGFHRDATACNIDQMHLGKPNAGLTDLRAPTTAYPKCVSPFGVHDLSGNVEEWVTLDHGVAPQRSSMKGAWWLPGKNNCRAATLGHGEVFEGPQVGVRCCKDASK